VRDLGIRTGLGRGKVETVAKALAHRVDTLQITRLLDGFALITVLTATDRATIVPAILDEISPQRR